MQVLSSLTERDSSPGYAKMKVHRSIRPVPGGWAPELWASPKPFGIGEQHSNNYWEIFRAVWQYPRHINFARSMTLSKLAIRAGNGELSITSLWGVFSNGESDGKRARCATALRPFYSPLRFKIWPSARPAACREAGTCLCGGSVTQPLRWPPAASWVGEELFWHGLS